MYCKSRFGSFLGWKFFVTHVFCICNEADVITGWWGEDKPVKAEILNTSHFIKKIEEKNWWNQEKQVFVDFDDWFVQWQIFFSWGRYVIFWPLYYLGYILMSPWVFDLFLKTIDKNSIEKPLTRLCFQTNLQLLKMRAATVWLLWIELPICLSSLAIFCCLV